MTLDFRPGLDFYRLSLLSRECKQSTETAPSPLSLSVYFWYLPRWVEVYFHITHDPKKKSPCLLPVASDLSVSGWLQGVPGFSLLLQYPPKILVLCCQGSKLEEYLAGKMKEGNQPPAAELNEA